MSTRANIVLKESYNDSTGRKIEQKLFFYRHSDGYPEGTLPTLNIFMDWLKTGKIRNSLSQAAGWLIILGAIEYGTIPKYKTKKPFKTSDCEEGILETIDKPRDNGSTWKVGAYEPTTNLHGDIQYIYKINLTTKKLTIQQRIECNWQTMEHKFAVIEPA